MANQVKSERSVSTSDNSTPKLNNNHNHNKNKPLKDISINDSPASLKVVGETKSNSMSSNNSATSLYKSINNIKANYLNDRPSQRDRTDNDLSSVANTSDTGNATQLTKKFIGLSQRLNGNNNTSNSIPNDQNSSEPDGEALNRNQHAAHPNRANSKSGEQIVEEAPSKDPCNISQPINNRKSSDQSYNRKRENQPMTNNANDSVDFRNNIAYSEIRKEAEEDNANNESSDNNDDNDDDDNNEDDDEDDEDRKNDILFPGYVPKAFNYLSQSSQPRYICLKMITSPWFERISMFVILVNCLTLGLYQPCNDNPCKSTRCVILQYLDHGIFVFFAIEMCIKIMAMGLIGKDTYLAETWNRLDLFIVIAGTVEYLIANENLSLSAIRTVRVLRPLRAINRVPSMRILVMLLLDTLPMLGNVLLLCFFVFFIFGIIGVQLWKGVLRNRCFYDFNGTLDYELEAKLGKNMYYTPEFTDSFICTESSGMATCDDIPPYINNSRICNGTIDLLKMNHALSNNSMYSGACVNWNAYYTKCRPSDKNPFKGAISFDNIGYAWVAIFQIISLESWVTIMYYIQDAHSFWNWIYFVFLIVIGSFFMINLCLVVIATQFSETKRRETERMIAERRRFSRSSSTLISDANDPGSCWEELLRLIEHFIRKSRRRVFRVYTEFREKRRLQREEAKQLQKPIELRENVALLNENVNNQNAAADNQAKTNNEPIKSNSLSTNISKAQQLSDQDSIRNNQSDSVKSSHVNDASKESSPSKIQIVREEADISDQHGANNSTSKIKIYRNIPQSSFKKKSQYLKATRLCHYFSRFRYFIKVFVDSKLFQRAILCAILINTLSMGVEHHEQPPLLTMIVEYSNIIFTAVFCLEMILKITAYGAFVYIKNAFNLFDGAIVGISIYEVVKQLSSSRTGEAIAPSGVSVLRTFRLLRILKLVRFMPALRRQLVVMLKTIDNVATFFSLLILFIFIFSILGMNLFGCKFCTKDHEGVRTCERKNFDSLLWAIITVFQVLTQEDWNEVLYNGMEKTSSWAALYFIALMTFGNYVLFNLLVAILVEGFSTEDEPKRAIEERIRLDAIQAIEEEDRQRELIQKARKSSKVSGSLHDADNQSSKSAQKVPQISVSNAYLDETRSGKTNQDEFSSVIHMMDGQTSHLVSDPFRFKNSFDQAENGANGQTNKIRLPIITHTCPTPSHTPSNSSKNLPLFSNFELEFDMKVNRMSPDRFIGKYERRFSLDSSRDMMKLKRFVSKANSSKIYDRSFRAKKVLFFSNNNMNTEKSSRLGNQSGNDESQQSASTSSSNRLLKKNRRSSSIKVKTLSSLEPPTHIHRYSRSKSEKSKSKSARVSRQAPERSSRLSSHASYSSHFDNLDEEPPANEFIESLSNVTCSSSKIQQAPPQIEPISEVNETEKLLNPKSDMSINVQTNMTKREQLRTSASSEQSSQKQKTPSPPKKSSFEEEEEMIDFDCCAKMPKPTGCFKTREEYALYILSKDNKLRLFCLHITAQKWFDYTILLFIACNCITLAMERPSIPPHSIERKFLTHSNYLFTLIFAIEMIIKVLANGFYVGENAYLKSGWNVMDGFLVIISTIDVIVTLSARSSPKIFGILRVFRLLRTLRPLRVISRAPGLKLVVQTLLSSLRPIGNIVLICCTFFIIFGILGVQLFKGKMYKCVGDLTNVKTKEDCLNRTGNQWINSQYNFDNLGQALMALFVLSSKDGWVSIMYTGIDAVGVDKQPIENYNEWMLVYFISFLLLVGFFVLNMFVGVVIENFHKCREEQEREEKARRAAKRAKKFEEKRRKMKEIPYYASYSRTRRIIHDICDSKYFDLVIAGVIGLNVVSMSVEFYMMPPILDEILDILNYIFTVIFLVEAIMRLVALGFIRYIREKWNQLDIIIVILSIVGILFDKLSSKSAIPINPTIIRVMRVLRIARVLKLLKMAKGIRSLLDTVIQALPQVGNLGLLFFLLFFIFAILGVELFGKLNCESIRSSCDGLSRHAHFHNFGMAFLTLFRIATGDNWNGIMKDTLRDNVLCHDDANPGVSMCLASILAPIYFVIFVLMAQFVLVNVVVAVLMKHLDDSNKMMADDAEMDEEIERQLEAEARNNIKDDLANKLDDNFDEDGPRLIYKQTSLPPNFTFDMPYDMQSKYSSTDTQLNSDYKKPTKSILNKKNILANRIPNLTDDSSLSEMNNGPSSCQRPIIQLTLYDGPKNEEEKCQSELKSTCLSDTSSFEGETDMSLNQLDMSVNSGPGMRPRKKSLSNSSDADRALSPSSSINYESDNVSTIMRQRFMQNRIRIQNDLLRASLGPSVTFKDHFSPKASLKIRVIDETDTETEQFS